jgi:hypothetical protein
VTVFVTATWLDKRFGLGTTNNMICVLIAAGIATFISRVLKDQS